MSGDHGRVWRATAVGQALSGVDTGALVKIDTIIKRGVRPFLPDMDANVLIEPIIVESRFSGGGKRLLMGPFGKSSLVRLQVKSTLRGASWVKEFY